MIWLQEYLNTFPSTLLVVAHDRDFIDNITQELIILRLKTLTYFDGNLSEYERNTREKRKNQIKSKEAMDKKKEAIEKTIDNAQRNARKTGDDNLAKMAKSRQKKLDDRWGIERNAKGGRFVLTVRSRISGSVRRCQMCFVVPLQIQAQSRPRRNGHLLSH